MSAEGLAVLATQGVAKSSSLSSLDLRGKTHECEGDEGRWRGAGRSSARLRSCLSPAIMHAGGRMGGKKEKGRRCSEHDAACRSAVVCCACFGMCVRQVYMN